MLPRGRLSRAAAAAVAAHAGFPRVPRVPRIPLTSTPRAQLAKLSTSTSTARLGLGASLPSRSAFVPSLAAQRALTAPDPLGRGLARHRRSFSTTHAARADRPFKLADIGEGITEVEVVKWLVAEGDAIEEFDALCEVQSDKSTVELTAPYTGTVRGIKFSEGETIRVGQVICSISDGEATASEADEGAEANSESETHAAEPNTTESVGEPGDTAPAPPQVADVATTFSASATGSAQSSTEEPEYHPVPPTEPDTTAQPRIQRTHAGEVIIPPPPPRQIVRPTQTPRDGMSAMDRALLASLRSAAEAGESQSTTDAGAYGSSRSNEAASAGLFAARDAAMDSAAGSAFSGEGGVVRHDAPREAVNTGPVPQRVEREEGRREIVKASPAVRVMAARLGVKLEEVKPTGPDGRVTQQDVQNAVGRSGSGGASPPQHTQASTSPSHSPAMPVFAPSAERSKIPEIAKVEFGRTRKVMYRAMGDQGHVPHFGYSHTLDLTPLLPYMRSMNASITPSRPSYLASDIPATHARDPLPDASKPKTTLLSFLVKGLMLAMEEHPVMRARAREQGSSRFLEIARDGVIGVAVSDPKYGLVTPSLPRMPPTAGLSAITSALAALRQNATKPSAPPHLTISSVGGLGEARDAMPVLPPGGGVAICAVGRARWEVEWKEGQSRTMDWTAEEVERGGTRAVLRCPVGWSGDHRVLEGAELIAFTETWKKYIEEPWRWLSVE